MRTSKALISLCAASLALMQCPAFASGGGRGTEADPYVISSELDFEDIAHDPSGHYILAQDITISTSLDTTFSGTLDGAGHRIEKEKKGPVFKAVSGTVKNIGIRADEIYADSILADTLSGTVSQAVFIGLIRPEDASNAGGIAGIIDGGTVTDCSVSVTVSANGETAGGIAGTAKNAKISNCFVNCKVSSSAGVSAEVIGVSENLSMSGVYYNSSATALPYGIGVGTDLSTPVDEAALYSASSYPSLSFGSVWTIIEGGSEPLPAAYYGSGTETSPYKIHSASDMKKLIKDGYTAGRHYRLENNIVSAYTVGSSEAPFNGHFDGGNHWMNSGSSLFDVIGENGIVENVVRSDSVGGTAIFGGIAGINYGTIRRCHTTGSFGSRKDCGGIAGENIGGTISDCSFAGSISVSNTGAGGIAGYNSYGTIERCTADVSISTRNGTGSIGGITGDNSYGLIRDCYARGSIGGTNDVGGIAGKIYNGSILSSYSACSVSGSSNTGGIFGGQYEDAYLENVYYAAMSKEPSSLNAAQKESYERTSEDMHKQSAYSGFDFTNTWLMRNSDSYPILRTIYGSGTKNDPFKLRTAADFNELVLADRSYYELEKDITTSGSRKNSFNGSLNGNGHMLVSVADTVFGSIGAGAYIGNIQVNGGRLADTVSGAKAEYVTVNGARLANSIDSCTIKNSRSVNSPKYSDSVAGGFANEIKNSTVTDCAAISCTANGSSLAGGFVGMASGSTIDNCYTYAADVTGVTAGGFIGRNDNGSKITSCSASGTVSGGTYTGTFAGMNYADISNSYSLSAPAEDGVTLGFAGIDGGTITEGTASADNYRIFNFGGSGTRVSVPDLPEEQETAREEESVLSDISGHWAEAAIKKLVSARVINGYDDGTYRPQNSVTKAEFIKLLLAAESISAKDGFTDYEDVNKHWAKNYVATAIALDICDNINESESVFGVDKAITRAEAVALMGRLIAKGESGTLSFTDNDAIPDWAKNEVGACVGKGIINGMDDGSFAPNNGLTRAESATIIYRLTELNK